VLTNVLAHDEDDDTRPNNVDTKAYPLRRKVSVCDGRSCYFLGF